MMAVNLTAVYVLTQAVLPGMIERGGRHHRHGRLAGRAQGRADRRRAYGAAKAAVRNLMGHVHNTLRNQGIRATTIMPAEVDTPILDKRPHIPDAQARATMMHGRGRGARDPALRDAAAADRDRGDHHEPDHPARPEPRHRDRAKAGAPAGASDGALHDRRRRARGAGAGPRGRRARAARSRRAQGRARLGDPRRAAVQRRDVHPARRRGRPGA